MKTIRCCWGSMHLHGPLWFDHLKLRKRVFVDGAGWGIPTFNGVEWDQFDTPATHYFITHDGGKVLASSRAIPCNFSTPTSSYMIRDATLGLLPGIPPSIFEEPPTTSQTWEATRFAVDPDLPDLEKRRALSQNAIALMSGCADQGAAQVLALMAPGFAAWFKRNGIPAEKVGPVTRNDDGERFCVIRAATGFLAKALPKKVAA